MASRRSVVTHIFGGGWATEFGTHAPVVPDQNGFVSIPYLIDAEDVLFELDGAPHKVPGSTALNSALESGAVIRGVYDYWKQSSGSPAQKRVVHVSTKIYKDDADGSFAEIASGLDADGIPNYSTFDDLLIIASDSSADVPKSWDQTTFQNLAGSPPNFSFSVKHKNYHFAAGVPGAPSTLYYCSQLDPEDWTGGDSGQIAIDPDDGDQIVAIASHKNELFVFKGPYKGSIHRITGSSDADWARTTFTEGVAATWQNALFRYGDDLGFFCADGTIRSLETTAAYGDFREAALSAPIQSWLDTRLNFSRQKQIQATTDASGRRVFFTLPIDSSTTNNMTIVADFRFTPVRWSQLPSYAVGSLTTGIDPTQSNRRVVFMGGNNGIVYIFGNSTRTHAGSGLSTKITLPFLNYGSAYLEKTLAAVGLQLRPHNSGNITFGWQRDTNTQQTATIAQGGTAVLDDFELDSDVLGGANFSTRWKPLEEGGQFKDVQYQITNSASGEDVEVHGITALLEGGGGSLENS